MFWWWRWKGENNRKLEFQRKLKFELQRASHVANLHGFSERRRFVAQSDFGRAHTALRTRAGFGRRVVSCLALMNAITIHRCVTNPFENPSGVLMRLNRMPIETTGANMSHRESRALRIRWYTSAAKAPLATTPGR